MNIAVSLPQVTKCTVQLVTCVQGVISVSCCELSGQVVVTMVSRCPGCCSVIIRVSWCMVLVCEDDIVMSCVSCMFLHRLPITCRRE